MQHCGTIRRHLTPWLVLWMIVLGVSPAIASSLDRRHQPTQRVASSSGTRSLHVTPAADPFGSGQPAILEAKIGLTPQWNVALLAKARTSCLGLLPADTARFGRAPPSSVL